MNKGKEMAVKDGSGIEVIPEYLRGQGPGRGSEQVDTTDITIPRIEIVQSLSKARKKNDPGFIEGAEEGMLYNSVTRELYGFSLQIVPIYFMKEYLLWRDQKLGGGFGGAYGTEAEALADAQTREKPEEWEAVLTHQHFCLILHEDGRSEEAVVSMSKSKLKVSRKFNSLVRVNGGDRFSRSYTLCGVADQNSQGQDYFNVAFATKQGFVTEPVFRHAEKVYELIARGGVVADRSTDDSEEPASGEY